MAKPSPAKVPFDEQQAKAHQTAWADYLGVPVEIVQEVFYSREMTRVPLAHPAVRGLVNLRGQLLTTIDLRCRLNLPEATGDCRQVNVVLRSQDGIV
ncbi:MAG: chemotaxis protein CheW, partial [Planctomycetes bacterium]|nr:chemotaxis protein CheW [Planctomycetota bacterium]